MTYPYGIVAYLIGINRQAQLIDGVATDSTRSGTEAVEIGSGLEQVFIMPYVRCLIGTDGIKIELVEGLCERQFQAIDTVATYDAGLCLERIEVNAGLIEQLTMPFVVVTLANLLLLFEHIRACVVDDNLIDGVATVDGLERVVIDSRFVEDSILVMVRESV